MSLNFFKVGDVVILKGNDAPSMTVVSVTPQHYIEKYVGTKWFDEDNHLHNGNFHQATLILMPQEEQ